VSSVDSITDADRTETRLITDNTLKGPGKVSPVFCPATTTAGLPAGPLLTPGGQGHHTMYISTVVEGPTSCGSTILLQARDTVLTPGESVLEDRTTHPPQPPDTTLAPHVVVQRAHPNFYEDTAHMTAICPNCLTTDHTFLQQSVCCA